MRDYFVKHLFASLALVRAVKELVGAVIELVPLYPQGISCCHTAGWMTTKRIKVLLTVLDSITRTGKIDSLTITNVFYICIESMMNDKKGSTNFGGR